MKFCWTTIQVSDLEKSIEFYSQVLGIGPVNRMGVHGHSIAMLGADGEVKLELICEEKPLPESVGTGVSMGFAPANLDDMISQLTNAGIPVVGPIAPSPHVRFYFAKDPDGYTVQLVEQK